MQGRLTLTDLERPSLRAPTQAFRQSFARPPHDACDMVFAVEWITRRSAFPC
ncbi:hypothetical protein RBSH_01533 [Rhodopirellula baltica SH28]|uniref:Uncharacterized protein n=1 Tax=Rhodopirellula baltica SH28 TaxID=993517 RepID=K5DLB9_RHOBT|nr:hypothetical protein RBSH_01533 [Rhodopirellula baltica SH28]